MKSVIIITGSEGKKEVNKILSEEFDKEINRKESLIEDQKIND